MDIIKSQGRLTTIDYASNQGLKSVGNTGEEINVSSASKVQPVDVNIKGDRTNGDKRNSDTNQRQLSDDEIEKDVEKLNELFKEKHITTEYSFHDELNTMMVKVIDEDKDKVILEIPPEKIVNMVAKMCEMAGILIDEKA